MNDGWRVYAPGPVEAAALRRGLDMAPGRDTAVVGWRSGTNVHATAAVPPLRPDLSPTAMAGTSLAVRPFLRPGEIVVASEIQSLDEGSRVSCPSAPLLASRLARRHRVHVGPVATTRQPLTAAACARLAARGIHAVARRPAHLPTADGTPSACVQVITAASHEAPALRMDAGDVTDTLLAVGVTLAEWAAATTLRCVSVAPPHQAPLDIPEPADVVLVLGPHTLAAASRLLQARRSGLTTFPVSSPADIDIRWLAGAMRAVVAPTARVPHERVRQVVEALLGLGARLVPPPAPHKPMCVARYPKAAAS